MIYFMQADVGGPIKIGYSATAEGVEKRRGTLQTGVPHKLVVRKVIRGTYAEEQKLHSRFGHLRLSGEWFEADVDLARLAGAVPTPQMASLLEYAELRREIIEQEFRILRAERDATYDAEIEKHAKRMAGRIADANERYLKSSQVQGRILRDVVMQFVPRAERPVVADFVARRLAAASLPAPGWLGDRLTWVESDDVTEEEQAERSRAAIRAALNGSERRLRVVE